MMQAGRSDSARHLRCRDLGKAAIVAGAGLGALLWAGYVLGIRVNLSPSLPVGLYRVDAGPAANLVEFCPGEPFGLLANARGYRHAGVCADGGSPLLKPVVARPGDMVTMSPEGVRVNGQPLPSSAPRTRDTAGRLLTPWPFGTYVVKGGTLWVLSSYHARSFDSRYFGPIADSAVRVRLRPLLVVK
jgi:conjugative transfer signal peptidase TraF